MVLLVNSENPKTPGKVIRVPWITRAMVKAAYPTIFVFGDNMERVGRGGQAKEMRGEPNTIGVPTKWKPNMLEGSFFSDDDYDSVITTINLDLLEIEDKLLAGFDVVIPSDGLGTGLSELPLRAPKIHEWIEGRIKYLEETYGHEKAMARPSPLGFPVKGPN